MKRLTLLCISPLVLANMAFAGGMNEPAYTQGHPHHHHHKPHHFSGFAVTGALGGIAMELDAKQNFDGESFVGDSASKEAGVPPSEDYDFDIDGEVAFSDNLELFEANIAGLIALEYNYQFDNGLVLGLAATAGFDNVEFKNTVLVSDAVGNNPATDFSGFDENFNFSNVSSTLKAELENDFAILFKPGFVVRENTLIYALVGPRWGNFETKLSTSYNDNGGAFCEGETDCNWGWNSTTSDSESNSEYEMGITAGVGIRQVLANHFMLGLEYAYTHYGDLDSLQNMNDQFFSGNNSCNPPNNGDCTDNFLEFTANAQDLIANTHTVMATLTYNF